MGANGDNDPDAWPGYRGSRRNSRQVVRPALTAVVTDNGDQNAPDRMSAEHFRREVVIVNRMGLHARPASMFVELANKFACEVAVHKAQLKVDGKSIMSLLALAAESGTKLLLETRGTDALRAIDALADLIASGFYEKEPADPESDSPG